MLSRERRCISCGITLLGPGTTVYPCPNCSKGMIGRCARCRDQSVTYRCTECGFQGP